MANGLDKTFDISKGILSWLHDHGFTDEKIDGAVARPLPQGDQKIPSTERPKNQKVEDRETYAMFFNWFNLYQQSLQKEPEKDPFKQAGFNVDLNWIQIDDKANGAYHVTPKFLDDSRKSLLGPEGKGTSGYLHDAAVACKFDPKNRESSLQFIRTVYQTSEFALLPLDEQNRVLDDYFKQFGDKNLDADNAKRWLKEETGNLRQGITLERIVVHYIVLQGLKEEELSKKVLQESKDQPKMADQMYMDLDTADRYRKDVPEKIKTAALIEDKAAKYYELALTFNPSHPLPHLKLAAYYLEKEGPNSKNYQNHLDQALKNDSTAAGILEVVSLTAKNPKVKDPWLMVAKELAGEKRYGDAAMVYRRAAELDAKNAARYHKLADAADKLDPTHPRYYLDLGDHYMRHKDPVQAAKAYQKGMLLDPSNDLLAQRFSEAEYAQRTLAKPFAFTPLEEAEAKVEDKLKKVDEALNKGDMALAKKLYLDASKNFQDMTFYGDLLFHPKDYNKKIATYQDQLRDLGFKVYFQNKKPEEVLAEVDGKIKNVGDLITKGKLKEAKKLFEETQQSFDDIRLYGNDVLHKGGFDGRVSQQQKDIRLLEFKLRFNGKDLPAVLADVEANKQKVGDLIAKGKMKEAKKLLGETQEIFSDMKIYGSAFNHPADYGTKTAKIEDEFRVLQFKLDFKGKDLPQVLGDLDANTKKAEELFESGNIKAAEKLLAETQEQLDKAEKDAKDFSNKPEDFKIKTGTVRAALHYYRILIKESQLSTDDLKNEYQKVNEELKAVLPEFPLSPYGHGVQNEKYADAFVIRARLRFHTREYKGALKDYESAILCAKNPAQKNQVVLEAKLFVGNVEDLLKFYEAKRVEFGKSKDLSNALMVEVLNSEMQLQEVLVGKWGDGKMYGIYDPNLDGPVILDNYQKASKQLNDLKTERNKYLEGKGEDVVLVQAQSMIDLGYLKQIPDVPSVNGKKLSDYVQLKSTETVVASAAPMGQGVSLADPNLELSDATVGLAGGSGLRLDVSSDAYKNLSYSDKVQVLQQLAALGMAEQNTQLREGELKLVQADQKQLDEKKDVLSDQDKNTLVRDKNIHQAKADYYDWRASLLKGEPQQAQLKMRQFKKDFLATVAQDPLALQDADLAKSQLLSKDPELEMMFNETQGMLRTFTRGALVYLKNQDALITETRKGGGIFKTRLDAAAYQKLADKLLEYMDKGRGDTLEELMGAIQADHQKMVDDFLKNPILKGDVVNLGDFDHKLSYADNGYDQRRKAINDFIGRWNSDPNASDPAVPTIRLEGGMAVSPPNFGVSQLDGCQKIVIGRKGGMIKIGAMSQPYKFPPLKDGEPDRDRVVLIYRGDLWTKHVSYGDDYEQLRRAMWDQNTEVDHGHWVSYRNKDNEALTTFFGTENLWQLMPRHDPSFKVFYDLNTQAGLERNTDPNGSRQYHLDMGKTLRSDGSYDVSGQTLTPLFDGPMKKVIDTQISDSRKQEIRTEIEKDRGLITIKKKEELIDWQNKYPDQYAHFSVDGPPTAEEWNALLEKNVQAEIDNRVNVKLFREGLRILDNWVNDDSDQAAKKAEYIKAGLTNPFGDDKVALDSFKTFEDMLNPLDKHWYENMSDRQWDAVDDFLFVTAVTLPMTMGVGSVAGTLVRGTALYAELSAEGSWILADVFLAGGASAVGMGVTQTFMNVPFGGQLTPEAFGLNILTGWAFHAGGAGWGKFANFIGIGEEATALAVQNGQVFKAMAMKGGNSVGMLATQVHLGIAFDYAMDLGTGHDPGGYLDYLGPNVAKQGFFHVAGAAFHASTGNFFLEAEGRGMIRGKIAKDAYERALESGKGPDEALKIALETADQKVPSLWTGKDPGKIYQGYLYKNAAELVEKWGIDPISPEGKALSRFFMSRLATAEQYGKFKEAMAKEKPANLNEFVQKVLGADPNSKTGQGLRNVFARVLVQGRGDPQLAAEFPEFSRWTSELEGPVRELLKKSGIEERGQTFKVMEPILLEAVMRNGGKPEEITALSKQAEKIPEVVASLLGAEGGKIPEKLRLRLTQGILLWALGNSKDLPGMTKNLEKLAELPNKVEPFLNATTEAYLKGVNESFKISIPLKSLLILRALNGSKDPDDFFAKMKKFSEQLSQAEGPLRATLEKTLGLESGKNQMPELMSQLLFRALATGANPDEVLTNLSKFSEKMPQFEDSLRKVVDQAFPVQGNLKGSDTPLGRQVMGYLMMGALVSGKNLGELQPYFDDLVKVAPDMGKAVQAGEQSFGKLVEKGGGEGRRMMAQLLLKALSTSSNPKEAVGKLNGLIAQVPEMESMIRETLKAATDSPLDPAQEKQMMENFLTEAMGSAKDLKDIPGKLKDVLKEFVEGTSKKGKGGSKVDAAEVKDALEVFGLTEAQVKENPNLVKKKYRELARKFHPDYNKGDKVAEEMFKKVEAANQVLEKWVEGFGKKKGKVSGADADKAGDKPNEGAPTAPSPRNPQMGGKKQNALPAHVDANQFQSLDQIQQGVLNLNGMKEGEAAQVVQKVVDLGIQDPASYSQALTLLTGYAKNADSEHFNQALEGIRQLAEPQGKSDPLSYPRERAQLLQSLQQLAKSGAVMPKHFQKLSQIAFEAGVSKTDLQSLAQSMLANPSFNSPMHFKALLQALPSQKGDEVTAELSSAFLLQVIADPKFEGAKLYKQVFTALIQAKQDPNFRALWLGTAGAQINLQGADLPTRQRVGEAFIDQIRHSGVNTHQQALGLINLSGPHSDLAVANLVRDELSKMLLEPAVKKNPDLQILIQQQIDAIAARSDVKSAAQAVPPPLLELSGKDPTEIAKYKADYQKYLSLITQQSSLDLPQPVQTKIRGLVKRSKDGNEHEFFAIQFGQAPIESSEFITSGHPFAVKNKPGETKAITGLLTGMTKFASRGGNDVPIVIYDYHSHPRRGKIHSDGRPYTETHSIDGEMWDGRAAIFVQQLREMGFRGPIKFVAGAVPAQSGSDEMPYIATYTKVFDGASERKTADEKEAQGLKESRTELEQLKATPTGKMDQATKDALQKSIAAKEKQLSELTTQATSRVAEEVRDELIQAKEPLNAAQRTALTEKLAKRLDELGIKLQPSNQAAVEKILIVAETAQKTGIVDQQNGISGKELDRLLATLSLKNAPPITSDARMKEIVDKTAQAKNPQEKRQILIVGLLQRETNIPAQATGKAEFVDFAVLQAESNRVAAADEAMTQPWAKEALGVVQKDVVMTDNNFFRQEKYLRIFDHHGLYGKEATGFYGADKNSTMKMLDAFEDALRKVGGEAAVKHPSDAQVKEAIKLLNIREVATDNMGDGGWTLWIAKNQERVLKEPGIRKLISDATYFEDFSAFGDGFNADLPAVKLQLALFDRYNHLIQKYNIQTMDRLVDLPSDTRQKAMDEIVAAIDQVLPPPGKTELPADTVTAANRFWKMVLEEAVPAVKAAKIESASVDGKLFAVDLDALKAIKNPDGSEKFPIFTRWLAVPRAHDLPLQLTVETKKVEANGVQRRENLIARPHKRELPSGKGLKTIEEPLKAFEAMRAKELEVSQAFWVGKDNILFPVMGSVLTPDEIKDFLTNPDSVKIPVEGKAGEYLKIPDLFEPQATVKPLPSVDEKTKVTPIKEEKTKVTPTKNRNLGTDDTEAERAAKDMGGKAQLKRPGELSGPELLTKAEEVWKPYSFETIPEAKAGEPENKDAGKPNPDLLFIEHLAHAPIQMGPLSRYAKEAMHALAEIPQLRTEIEEKNGKLKDLPANDPLAKTLRGEIAQAEGKLRQHIETVIAYQYAKHEAELVSNRAVQGYQVFSLKLTSPLHINMNPPVPMSAAKGKVFSVIEDNPISLESFSYFGRGVRHDGGGLTFVVHSKDDIASVVQAIRKTSFSEPDQNGVTPQVIPHLVPERSHFAPDQHGEAVLVYEVKGPHDSQILFHIKVRAVTEDEKARADKAAQARGTDPQMEPVSQGGNALQWEPHPTKDEWVGHINGVKGLEFAKQGGELWARSTDGPRQVILNGKDIVEIGDQFAPVAEHEGDKIQIEGTVYKIAGNEDRLILDSRPENFGVESAAPVRDLLSSKVRAEIKGALPKDAQTVEVSLKVSDWKQGDNIEGALQAQVPASLRDNPNTFVVMHLERAHDNGSVSHFILVDSYQNLMSDHRLGWIMTRQKDAGQLHLDYIVQPSPDGGPPTIHFAKIRVNPDLRNKGLGQKSFADLMQSLGREYPGANMTTHAVNSIVVNFFSKYLDGVHGIQIQNGMANPIDMPLQPEFLAGLEKSNLLSHREVAELQKILQGKYIPGQLTPPFQAHNRLWEMLEQHCQEALKAGTTHADSSAAYLFEVLQSYPDVFDSLKKVLWGDMWIEGKIPSEPKDMTVTQLSEADMLDVEHQLGENDIVMIPDPPAEPTIYEPTEWEVLTNVDHVYTLDDPKLFDELYQGEVRQTVTPPPPPAEAYAGERRKALNALAKEFDIPVDYEYFQRLEKVANQKAIDAEKIRNVFGILKPAFDSLDPFISDIARREFLLLVVQGSLDETGAKKISERIVSGEMKLGFEKGNELKLQFVTDPEEQVKAKETSGLLRLFRETKASVFGRDDGPFATLRVALLEGKVSLKQLELLAGQGLSETAVSHLEKLWGPRSAWLAQASTIFKAHGVHGLEGLISQVKNTQEIVALAQTQTPFAKVAQKYEKSLSGKKLGSREYKLEIEAYEKERNAIAQPLVQAHEQPMLKVKSFLNDIFKKVHGVKVEARLKNPADVGAKVVRRGYTEMGAITDFAGTRIVVKGPEDVLVALDKLKEKYKIRDTHDAEGAIQVDVSHTEIDEHGQEVLVLDSIPDHDLLSRLIQGGKTGYRAIHVVAEVDGKPVEIQIQTEALYRWGKIQHQAGYKNELVDENTKGKIDDYFKKAADYLSARERLQTGLTKPEMPKLKGLPKGTQEGLQQMEKLLDEYGEGAQVVSLDQRRQKKADQAKPVPVDRNQQAAAKNKDLKGPVKVSLPVPTDKKDSAASMYFQKAIGFLKRIRIRVGLGSILPGEFYLAPAKPVAADPTPANAPTQAPAANPPVEEPMIHGSTTALFMAVGHYDMIATDFSVKGSYVLDSHELKLPGPYWKIQVDYVPGPNGEVFAKITPLEGSVQFEKQVRDPKSRFAKYDFVDVPKEGMELKQDMLRFKLGGREFDYGTPNEANSFRHEFFRQMIDFNGWLESFTGDGKDRLGKVIKNPELWGKQRSQEAAEFYRHTQALEGKYKHYMHRLQNPRTDRQSLADEWKQIQKAFTQLKAGDFYQWYHGMELNYSKVLDQVQLDLRNFDNTLMKTQMSATKAGNPDGKKQLDEETKQLQAAAEKENDAVKKKDLLDQIPTVVDGMRYQMDYPHPETVGLDGIEEFRNLETRGLSGIVANVNVADDAAIQTMILHLAKQGYALGPYNNKTKQVVVRIDGEGYSYFVKMQFRKPGDVQAQPEAEPAAEFDAAAANKSGPKQSPVQNKPEEAKDPWDAPTKPADKPTLVSFQDAVKRIASKDPLRAGEDLELVQSISVAKTSSENKLEILLRLARRPDFTAFPEVTSAILNTGVDMVRVEKALTEIASLPHYSEPVSKAGSGSMFMGAFAGGTLMMGDPKVMDNFGKVLDSVGMPGLVVAGAAALIGIGLFAWKTFFSPAPAPTAPQAKVDFKPDPNVQAILQEDAKNFGQGFTPLSDGEPIAKATQHRLNAGEWVARGHDGNYYWYYYHKGGVSVGEGTRSDEATYEISKKWYREQGFPRGPRLLARDPLEAARYESLVAEENKKAEVSKAKVQALGDQYGIKFTGNVSSAQWEYLLAAFQELPASFLKQPGYLREINLGGDHGAYTEGGHFENGVANIYYGATRGSRLRFLGMVLHEMGHSTGERYALNAQENKLSADPLQKPTPPDESIPLDVRSRMHEDFQIVAALDIHAASARHENHVFLPDWTGENEHRKVKLSSFNEFVAEFHLQYVLAGDEMRQHIATLEADPKTREQGQAYERIYNELKDRVFSGIEYSHGQKLSAPAEWPQVAAPVDGKAAAGKPSPAGKPSAHGIAVPSDGEYVVGGGRKGNEGDNYIQVPDRVVDQHAALLKKSGDHFTLKNHPDGPAESVWVLEEGWGRVQRDEEYHLAPGQSFALGKVRFGQNGKPNFDSAVVLTVGADGNIYPARELVDIRAPQIYPAPQGKKEAPTWLKLDKDARPTSTHHFSDPKTLAPGTYQVSAVNLEIPVAPLMGTGYPYDHFKIMTGDPKKQAGVLKDDGGARVIVGDFMNSGSPQDWADVEVKGGKWNFQFSDKIQGTIRVEQGGKLMHMKPGSKATLGDGDEVQIGGIEYKIDGKNGKLVPLSAEHSGKISATLVVPYEEAAEAAAQADKAGRIPQQGANNPSPTQPKKPAPPALDPHTMRDLPDFAAKTRQVAYNEMFQSPLILPLKKLTGTLLAKSEKSGLEFGAVALEVDGRMIAPESNYMTSHSSRHVDAQEFWDMYQNAMGDVALEEGLNKNGTVRIYDFHTHPTREAVSGFVRSPNFVHEDGRPFTLTNDADWQAYQSMFKAYVQDLRAKGFTGAIEMVAGAIPTRAQLENPGLKPDKAKEPYIAMTTLRVEAGQYYGDSSPANLVTPRKSREVSIEGQQQPPEKITPSDPQNVSSEKNIKEESRSEKIYRMRVKYYRTLSITEIKKLAQARLKNTNEYSRQVNESSNFESESWGRNVANRKKALPPDYQALCDILKEKGEDRLSSLLFQTYADSIGNYEYERKHPKK